jgi:hypothetical protein
MMAGYGQQYQGRDGALRLLDKTGAGSPWGIQVKFEQMDMRVAFVQRPEEIPRLDRERLTDDAHLQLGSDEPIFQPIDVTFSFRMGSQEQDAFLEFAGVEYMNRAGANTADWTVKGTPAAGLVSTKGRALSGDGLYAGGRIDGKGSAVVLPPFADRKKVCVDVETIWGEVDGSHKMGFRMTEVYFEPGQQNVSEAADAVTVNMTGRVYGKVDRINAFTPVMNVLTSRMIS